VYDVLMVLSPDERMRSLKSVVAVAIARKLDSDPFALDRVRAELRLKPDEATWARTQQIDGFTLSRMVRIALALGCDVSIDAR
jgi:hypothetical protein